MSNGFRNVSVWLAWRDAPMSAEQRAHLTSALSDDELARASRYRRPADAEAFRWSRGVQRAILAAHLGVEPRTLRFLQQGDHKPALAPLGERRCEYNASHSGALFALAVSDHPVGVDIECARLVPRLEKVASRVFGRQIAAAISAAPGETAQQLFFTAWTQLEAHAKLHGQGVWRLLAHRELHAASEGVRVASFEAPPGYFGAVALAGAEPRVTTHWWADDAGAHR